MNGEDSPLSSEQLAAHVRRRVLELSYKAHVGHIGSCLSVADLLAVVYTATWFDPHALPADRDRFILSKGHAGLALYAALEGVGIIATEALNSFGSDGTAYGVHPEVHQPGVDFSTGSLGQGMGMATGAALAHRIQRSPRHVIALLSDAECNSGATWEAIHFAGHHQLPNLVALIDVNGQQALGRTADILDPEPFSERWHAARWQVREVDGHDHHALREAIKPSHSGPVAVVARTTFGAGVAYMEGQLDWHYLPMSNDQYIAALGDVGVTNA